MRVRQRCHCRHPHANAPALEDAAHYKVASQARGCNKGTACLPVPWHPLPSLHTVSITAAPQLQRNCSGAVTLL